MGRRQSENQDVEVVAKFNDSSIDRMNDFIKQEFINNLLFYRK